jgi:hypothetical protein
MQGFAGQQDPVFAFSEGVLRAETTISDNGPFRVRLVGIDYDRRLSYLPEGVNPAVVPAPPRAVVRGAGPTPTREHPRLNPVTSVQFTAQFLVTAEPRLSLAPRGELRLREAIDERGGSLIPEGRRGQGLNQTAYFGAPHGPMFETVAQLKMPANPGETIKMLRGAIPVAVSARRPDPLIVPLENSAGKTFQNSDIQLTVHEIRTLPDSRHTMVEISVRSNRPEALSGGDPEAYNSIFMRAQQQLQLDVLDARDRLMSWFQSNTDAENGRVTLTMTSPIQSAPPKQLRYYLITRSECDIPFEFTDIPMP